MDETRASIYALRDGARRELLASIEGIPPETMSGLVIGDWSVKDVLAHVAFWEEIAVPDFERAARGHKLALATFQPQKYTDLWNQIAMDLRREFPLDQVLHELHSFRKQMTQRLDALPDAAFTTVWAPTYCAISAYHDRDHAGHIREWRQREGV